MSRLCCFCHVDQFDKSFGADGFWNGHVLYKRQLFGGCGSSLLHREFTWQDRHQTKVLMMVIHCTLLEQIVWNSCFNDSCSRLIDEISETTCPTRAIASLLSVTISFVLIWDFTARSLSQVVTIAKVAFFKACCMLARRKSAFLLAAFRGAHISEFTRAICCNVGD